MKLAAYLKLKKIPAPAFAKQVKASVSTVYRWMAGEVLPRAEQLARIEKLTKGEVRLSDFIRKATRK